MKTLMMLKKFWTDESGQNTTEYILMLAVIFTVFMQFKKSLMSTVKKLLGATDSAADKAVSDLNSDGG